MPITPFACYHMMLTILCLLPQQYAYYTICIRPHCAYHLTPIAITTCLLRHIMMIMKIKETRMVRQIGEIRNIKNIIHNKNNNYAHSSAYDYAILGHAIAITIWLLWQWFCLRLRHITPCKCHHNMPVPPLLLDYGHAYAYNYANLRYAIAITLCRYCDSYSDYGYDSADDYAIWCLCNCHHNMPIPPLLFGFWPWLWLLLGLNMPCNCQLNMCIPPLLCG